MNYEYEHVENIEPAELLKVLTAFARRGWKLHTPGSYYDKDRRPRFWVIFERPEKKTQEFPLEQLQAKNEIFARAYGELLQHRLDRKTSPQADEPIHRGPTDEVPQLPREHGQ